MEQRATPEDRRAARGMGTFMLIWFGQLVSLLGSGLTGFALSVWVFQQTGSATQLTLISFFAVLPIIVFSPLAGALVDRWPLRLTMMLNDIGGALTTLGLVALLSVDRLTIWSIYAIVGATAVFSAFQFPAFAATTTLIVPKEQFGRASGMVQLAQGLSQLLAPVLAGVLVGWIGLGGVIAIDFATCLFAVATLLVVRIPPRPPATEGELSQSLLRDVTYGWTYITARPGLLSLLLIFAASNFMTGTVVVLANPLILSFATPAVLGTVLSVAGVGVLAGSVVMSIWGGPKRKVYGALGGVLLTGVTMIIGGLAPSAILIGVIAFFFTSAGPLIASSSQAIWQRKVAPNVQGRVFATRSMIATSSLPLAFLVTGPLADYVFEPLLAPGGALAGSVGRIIGVGPGRGIAFLLMVFGVLMILLVIGGYLYPRLRYVEDELPDAIPDQPPGEVERAGQDLGQVGQSASKAV
jgi:MFS transporter, DHA3 family, macrolide efflux protein